MDALGGSTVIGPNATGGATGRSACPPLMWKRVWTRKEIQDPCQSVPVADFRRLRWFMNFNYLRDL